MVWTEVVGLAILLSYGFGRPGLMIGCLATFAVAVVVWLSRGRPAPPSFRSGLARLQADLADPALAIMALTAILVVVWAVVVGIATPQNEWDSLSYHLTRAAFWIQQGALGYIPDTSDIKIKATRRMPR